MVPISKLMNQLGWTQEMLALYAVQGAGPEGLEIGPPWWHHWPKCFRQAMSHRGLVYEVQALPGSGGTSLALTAMVAHKQRLECRDSKTHWVMGIEPPGLCFNGQALAALGIANESFIMGRIGSASLSQMALQAVRSGLFAAVFVDLSRVQPLSSWRVASRRLMLAAKENKTTVWLQTNLKVPRQKTLSAQVKLRVLPNRNNIRVQLYKHARGGAPWEGQLIHPATWNLESERRMFVPSEALSGNL